MRLLEPSENDYPEEGHECEPVTERSPLLPLKPEQSSRTYGACHKEEGDEDRERGSRTSSSLWLSMELYDEKMCMICYDEERNRFFVPCGHCATCRNCAERMVEDEGRACPICRRPIKRLRNWFTH